MQIGQLNPLFHTFANSVNRIVTQQTSDWFMPNSQFSPTVVGLTVINNCQF